MTSTRQTTLIDVLRAHAAERGSSWVYRFLRSGDADGPHDELTYAGLDLRARALAVLLRRAGAAGERVLLLYPPGLDFPAAFFGCLYAGAVAVPAYPPHAARPERTLPGLRAVVRDAEPAFVLTTADLAAALDLEGPRRIVTDRLDEDAAASWRRPDVDPERRTPVPKGGVGEIWERA